MKSIVAVILIMVCSTALFAQKKKKKDAEQKPVVEQAITTPVTVPEQAKLPERPQLNAGQILTQHYYKKYKTATQWNDLDVAKNALYDLIIENPANDSLIFSLGYFYFENQKYASAALIGQELLARNSKNASALELAAVSFEALSVMDKAVTNYESLYLITGSSATLYKMAFLQYDLKRFKESMANVDILLAHKDTESAKVSFTDGQNKPKEYPMKVALLNLKGLLTIEEGDKVGAKKLFMQALTIAPDFQLAKNSLAKLK